MSEMDIAVTLTFVMMMLMNKDISCREASHILKKVYIMSHVTHRHCKDMNAQRCGVYSEPFVWPFCWSKWINHRHESAYFKPANNIQFWLDCQTCGINHAVWPYASVFPVV